MRIEFSIRDRLGVTRDFALVARAPIPVSLVATELGATDPDARLWCGDQLVSVGARFGAGALRTGAILSVGAPDRLTPPPGVLALHHVGGLQAGRILPLERGRYVIGRSSDCDLVLSDPDASRRHAVLDVGEHAISIIDCGSTNGTTVDGEPVQRTPSRLTPGQLIRIGDSTLAVVGPTHVPATLADGQDASVRVLRPPRNVMRLAEAEIELPQAPTRTAALGIQWATALLPAVGGGAIAWFAHAPQFLLFALLSPLVMIGSSIGDRTHARRLRRRDVSTYRKRDDEARAAVAAALRAEAAARHTQSPDPAAVLRIAQLPGARLWERQRGDHDVLHVRLGSTEMPAITRIRDGSAVRTAVVRDVPAHANLRDNLLGLTGPAPVIRGVARWLVGQLATFHSPADVSLALLLSPDQESSWEWARWLPQLRHGVAVTQDEWAAQAVEIQRVVEQRHIGTRNTTALWQGPWLVIIVDRAARLATVPGLAESLARGPRVGVTAICIDEDSAALPPGCRTVVQISGVTGSRATVRTENDGLHTDVIVDAPDADWAESLARCLAPLTDAGGDGSAALPSSCGLLGTLDAESLTATEVIRRWQRTGSSGRHANTAVGIGVDGPLSVDLVEDGPHALIAGTTGAGKSELLQTFVAGLAVNQAPDDLNFLLIDYKGGAAFAECAQLPHTAGLVTDLDPFLTARALRSLHSELRRRERLFTDAGVADLPAYRARGVGEPIARLVIVVDEFATLREELPDFVRGLVGVAQRGRSLGVHLVLATQRPGSAVSPEIRANTSLRIALRVTDGAESTDVIGCPDAALIERSTPGRAYVQRGAALSAFQTAYAGGVLRPATAVVVEPLGAWRRPAARASREANTELQHVVHTLRRAAADARLAAARAPWLPPLPTQLRAADLEPRGEATRFGIVDLPADQRTETLAVELGSGASVLVAGAARSGRTTLLATIGIEAACHYSPDDLHVYVIDAGGPLAHILEDLPHCATVLGPERMADVPLLLRRLDAHCAGARRTTSPSRASATPSRSLVLIDGWESILAQLTDGDALACADLLTSLLRSGAAAGLDVILSGDRTVLAPRFAAGFTSRILLRQADRADFGLAGVSPRDVPTEMLPGRGIRADDSAAVQVAHAGDAPDAEAARTAVEKVVARWPAGRSPATPVIELRPLPEHVALSAVFSGGGFLLGVGGDAAERLPFDPFPPGGGPARFLVAGPPRSGRSTLLRTLLAQALRLDVAIRVAGGPRSPLLTAARAAAVPVLDHTDNQAWAEAPTCPTLVLVDDCEALLDCPVGDALADWARRGELQTAFVVAGRNDDLATTYRGIGAHIRRYNCGLLLRPTPLDGELLGIKLPRRHAVDPAGRGVIVGDPSWGAVYADAEPLPVQVAVP